MAATTIVIAGGGHAAGMAAAALRQNGFDGRCIVVGDDPHPPYQRPPLSKQFLSGEYGVERVLLRPAAFYATKNIELLTGRRVERIDASGTTIVLDGGEGLAYDRLLLTLGSRARRLDLPGAALPGIFYLRTIADADRMREALVAGRRLVIVGGGYIGLEVAAVAIRHGVAVTLLEIEDRILKRVATVAMSSFFDALHAGHGIDIRCGARVLGFEGDGRVESVLTQDGRLAADAVLIGAGVLPNVEIAAAAGIRCDNGIVADAHCRTSGDRIFAAGDVCRGFNATLDRHVRLESVPNATDQARVAAATMLDRDARVDAVPWFWSDQYDVKLQMAGFPADADRAVTRGGGAGGAPFLTFHLRGDTVVAVDAINSPREFLAARQLIDRRVPVSDDRLVDPSVELKSLVA